MYTAKGNGILFASEDADFGEKYTRSNFKFKYGGQYNSSLAKAYWDELIKGQTPIVRNVITGKDYSTEDSIKIIHCMNCDKILINNAYRYCKCEYKIIRQK